MRRLDWTAAALAALMLGACSGNPDPREVQVVNAEEDAYRTTVFAQQRAEWLERAEQGHARSQRQLGIMYYQGQGVEVDYAIAYSWLSKAADQGDDVAQTMLGVMYGEGQGVPQDRVKAHMWLSLGAQQGNTSAKFRLESLTPQMSETDLAEAQRLATEWQPL